MARQANLPSTLSLDGNVHQNWVLFKTSFETYLGAIREEKSATEIEALTPAAKKNYYNSLGKLFLNIAGEEAIGLTSSFGLNDEDKYNYLKLTAKFEECAVPKANQTYERFLFNRCRQQEGETFDHFLADIKKKKKNCGLGDQEESIVRDRTVEGITDNAVRRALLKVPDLKLESAILECRVAEQSMTYSQVIQQDN